MTDKKEELLSKYEGDPKCVNPRLHCTNCDEWIHATLQRGFEPGVLTLECDCKITFPDGDLPEVWVRAF